ncbi:Dabb family protein [Microlunatus flavus]|uniref:Stress responsive A/B Barrel Domain n=1 Tax=Microlunatus flavus TaxID=1036181 RepID=A0A1H9NRU4_9ACTN|nr:Dabb family protein [Microlunatus flavus]SER38700.1 Stress responsive A/B Barrel Domain [Microlunatus flavus]
MTTTHVVLVSWRDGEAEEAERVVRPLVAGFRESIPDVLAVAEGPSTSPEGKEEGFDYALVITFASPEARDAYLPHPAHQPVAQAIGAHADKVVVFDV